MRSILALFAMLAGFLVVSPPASAAPLLFRNVTVVPMDRERVLAARDVIVENGVIRSIAPHSTRAPAGAQVVDGTGKFLVPGLIDLHVHTQFGDERQLELYPLFGVTTVLNLSGTPELLEWRQRIRAGSLLGPGFFTSGPILDGDPPTSPNHSVVRDRAAADSAVRAQVAAGYDFVKPYSNLSKDAFAGVVSASRRAKIRLVGHVSWNVGVDSTIDAGQEAIAHIEELYRAFVDRHRHPPADARPDPSKIPALAARLKEHGTWVISTLSSNTNILAQATALDSVLARPEMELVPASYRAECRSGDPYAGRGADWILQNRIMVPFLFRIAAGLRKAGVHVVTGTDATNPIQIPGLSLHQELAALVQAGFTPYEALAASTREAARFLGRDPRAGMVTAGAPADLVLLDGNPLVDVGNARRIDGVLVHGRWLGRDELATLRRDLVDHLAQE